MYNEPTMAVNTSPPNPKNPNKGSSPPPSLARTAPPAHITPPATAPPAHITSPAHIASLAKNAPNQAGVYKFIAANGKCLYVGKALSLKKRIASYARPTTAKLVQLTHQAHRLEITPTASEGEALLLENNLIKALKPRYNVLLRDDKSYPYIKIGGGDWARVSIYRGAKKGELFGPYASASALKETMNALERAFLLRTCSDGVFANRRRPCLLYQIGRCSAPCVGKISKQAYGKALDQARSFLKGKSDQLQQQLASQMRQAAAAQDFETALKFRNRISALTKIQSRQDVESAKIGDADFIGISGYGSGSSSLADYAPPTKGTPPAQDSQPTRDSQSAQDTQPLEDTPPAQDSQPTEGTPPAQDTQPTGDSPPTQDAPASPPKIGVIFFRNGRYIGDSKFTPTRTKHIAVGEVLAAFISQFYNRHKPPPTIALSHKIDQAPFYAQALTQHYGFKVAITVPKLGIAKRLTERARLLATAPSPHRASKEATQRATHKKLAGLMTGQIAGLVSPPRRVEVFDNAHLGGEAAVGAVTVFSPHQPEKSQWRRYNLGAKSDTAMMEEVFTKRFGKPREQYPDLIIIDGGKAQINAATKTLKALGALGVGGVGRAEVKSELKASEVMGTKGAKPASGTASKKTPRAKSALKASEAKAPIAPIAIVGIAKGIGRKSGQEKFYHQAGLFNPTESLRLHLLRLRDTAHKFANSATAKKRTKKLIRSALEDIPQIGKAKRIALLTRFGSVAGVSAASVEDIAHTKGISKVLAEAIHARLHR